MNHFRKNPKILAAFRSDSQAVQRIPLRAFLVLFFLVFLLVFLAAAVPAAPLDRPAVDFFATFLGDLLTVLFGLVLAFAACLRAVRFLRGA